MSFSNTAVDVLSDRLEGPITVQTFHAFTQLLTRSHYRTLGFSRAPALLAPTGQLAHVRNAIRASRRERVAIRAGTGVNLSTNDEHKRLAEFFTRIQGDGKLAKQLASDPESEFSQYLPVLNALRQIHHRYREAKHQANVIDYGDMLRLGRAALEQGLGLPYQYLFVDECQDMSRAQVQLLSVLATVISHVMTFGDPFQAVFGFSGGRFQPLSSSMDGVHTFRLTQSFRLTQRTANLASAIGAPLLDDQLAIRGLGTGLKPLLVHCQTIHHQTQRAVNIIGAITVTSCAMPAIAVLARTKAQLRDLEVALLAVGYNAQPLHRQSLPKHIDTLFNILDLAEQCGAHITETPKLTGRQLERSLLVAAGMAEAQINNKVVAACRRSLQAVLLSPTLQGRYVGARKVYEKLLRSVDLLDSDTRAELGRWEPLSDRFTSFSDFQQYIHEVLSKPAIALATIHASKGKEWDHVLLLGLTDGSLPFYRMVDGEAEDEERRLFYVAASRPRERLYMFHAPYHHAPSGSTYERRSRFMAPQMMKLVDVPHKR